MDRVDRVVGERVDLPGVTWLGGDRVVAADVRALTGADELAIATRLGAWSPLEVSIELVARSCTALHTLGGGELPMTPSIAAAMAAGDREALTLQVRAATFGDRLVLVVDCPEAGCGEPMDLDMVVADVLVGPLDDPAATVICGDHTLRRPNGEDQRAVGARALDDPLGAAGDLFRRCVVDGDPQTIDLETAEAALDRADPQAACQLSLRCPSCDNEFVSLLDAGELVARELIARRDDLDVSTHLLAWHYHWSYAEIINLPISRRRRFIELVTEALHAGTS